MLMQKDIIIKPTLLYGLFFLIFVFLIQLTVNVQRNFADDWSRTVDLWSRKATALKTETQPLPYEIFKS